MSISWILAIFGQTKIALFIISKIICSSKSHFVQQNVSQLSGPLLMPLCCFNHSGPHMIDHMKPVYLLLFKSQGNRAIYNKVLSRSRYSTRFPCKSWWWGPQWVCQGMSSFSILLALFWECARVWMRPYESQLIFLQINLFSFID